MTRNSKRPLNRVEWRAPLEKRTQGEVDLKVCRFVFFVPSSGLSSLAPPILHNAWHNSRWPNLCCQFPFIPLVGGHLIFFFVFFFFLKTTPFFFFFNGPSNILFPFVLVFFFDFLIKLIGTGRLFEEMVVSPRKQTGSRKTWGWITQW